MNTLGDLIAKIASSVVAAIWGIIERSRLEAEAERARAMDAYLEGRRAKEQTERALVEQLEEEVTFSYELWEQMRTT